MKKQRQNKFSSVAPRVTDAPDTPRKPVDVTRVKNILDIGAVKKKLKESFNASKVMLITMELRTGDHIQFTVMVDGQTFVYDGGEYVIDDALKYYNRSAHLWCLDYHQDISIPLRRKIDKNAVVAAVEQKGITDVDMALNPISMRGFVISSVIQKIMQGASWTDFMRFMKIMAILTLISSVLGTLILLNQSGILQNFKLW